jgi:hypothetical protein
MGLRMQDRRRQPAGLQHDQGLKHQHGYRRSTHP